MATVWVAILMRSMFVSDFQEKELTMAIRNISSFASDSTSVVLIEVQMANVDRIVTCSTLLVGWATGAVIGPTADFG